MKASKTKSALPSAGLKRAIRQVKTTLANAGMARDLASVVSEYYCVKYHPELFDLHKPEDLALWVAHGGKIPAKKTFPSPQASPRNRRKSKS